MIAAKMRLPFFETMAREKRRTLSGLVQVRNLMPSLTMLRNYQKWTSDDKRELRFHLKRLSRVSAYIALVVLPGGFVLMPVMAWWLNRRRSQPAIPQV
jgi:hypothetical protein